MADYADCLAEFLKALGLAAQTFLASLWGALALALLVSTRPSGQPDPGRGVHRLGGLVTLR